MTAELPSLISELGGKHGGLEHLRGNPNIAPWVVPNVVLSHRDQYSRAFDLKVRKLCAQFDTNEVVVRTSEKSDWDCMVDTMPTVEGLLDDVARIVDQVREDCHAESLLEYARITGNGYDPKKVSVSVAPKFPRPWFTLTEHPNQQGTLLLDALNHYEDMGWLTDVVDIVDYCRVENPSYRLSTHAVTEAHSVNAPFLVGYARDGCDFDDDDALQFEHVNQPGTDALPFITQVRWFARKQMEDFEVQSIDLCSSNRIFGIATEKDDPLPLAKGYDRFESIMAGENLGRPYALFPQDIKTKLQHCDNPLNMRSYVAGLSDGMEALSHNNTRFVQMCLRRGGVAVLDRRAHYFLKDETELRLITNGKKFSIPSKTD